MTALYGKALGKGCLKSQPFLCERCAGMSAYLMRAVRWNVGLPQLEVVLAEGFGELFDGVAESGAGHRGGIFI